MPNCFGCIGLFLLLQSTDPRLYFLHTMAYLHARFRSIYAEKVLPEHTAMASYASSHTVGYCGGLFLWLDVQRPFVIYSSMWPLKQEAPIPVITNSAASGALSHLPPVLSTPNNTPSPLN